MAAELSPLRGVNCEAIARDANVVADYADAVNLTDNQAASMRMSSISASALFIHHGVVVVVQMSCRDRNRLAIQADLLGAAANPFAPPYEYRPYRLAKKMAAGARFIQTQLIYNVNRFRAYMKQVNELGLDERA